MLYHLLVLIKLTMTHMLYPHLRTIVCHRHTFTSGLGYKGSHITGNAERDTRGCTTGARHTALGWKRVAHK